MLTGINQPEPSTAGGAQILSSRNVLNKDTQLELNTGDTARNLVAYEGYNLTATEKIVPQKCRYYCGMRCRW